MPVQSQPGFQRRTRQLQSHLGSCPLLADERPPTHQSNGVAEWRLTRITATCAWLATWQA